MAHPFAKTLTVAIAVTAGVAAVRSSRRGNDPAHLQGGGPSHVRRTVAIGKLAATRASDIAASAMGWRDADTAEQSIVVDLTGELAGMAHRHTRPVGFDRTANARQHAVSRRAGARPYVSSR